MIQIVADDKIPFLKGALDSVARVTLLPGREISRKEIAGADALIVRTRTRCDRELLEGTGIRFIATATIGYDHIDASYCSSAGIEWTSAPGCNAESVRQYMVSCLLNLSELRGLDPGALTIGVIGVGNVGSRVAAAAELLGMKVLLNDPPRAEREGHGGFVVLEELLRNSDIVTLHVPLNRGGIHNTYRMVNKDFLGKIPVGAILINTSRGEVVDEDALLASLRHGHLSDTVLDVFDNEPRINPELLDAITLATPHIAGYSLDGKANGTTVAVRAVSRFFGLGMDRWAPEAIPLPDEHQLHADAVAGSLRGVVRELYLKTYDIREDDARLRREPEAFERLRGDYPLRREPSAFTVNLSRDYPEIIHTLEGLGFKININENG